MIKHWRLVYLAIPLTILVFCGIVCVNAEKATETCTGIGRATAVCMTAGRTAEDETAEIAVRHYTEGDGPAPDWWEPDEPMAAEWVAAEAHPPVGIDPGGVDWNIETEMVGWDGHTMTGVELDLFSRIAYLEVWGSSEECCKAVVDAILALWDSGYYGNTLFETLSAVTETGWYAFSTYPGMWSVTYDSNGLDEMRTLCMERFVGGYEYDAPFFRTDYYHPWAVDAYHIDNVYFSYSPWWR